MGRSAEPAEKPAAEPRRRSRREPAPKPAETGADALGKLLTSREGKRIQRQVMRGVFGMLKKRL
jgi:hypothetical protein